MRTSSMIFNEIEQLKLELEILEEELEQALQAEKRNREIQNHDDEQYAKRHE